MLLAHPLPGHTRERLALLLESQYWPGERLRQLQLQKLQQLLEHCHASVPFYRRRFERAGFIPSDIHIPGRFERIPVLEKSEIQSAGAEMISTSASSADLLPDATGGSTGRPLAFFHDRNYWEWEKAAAIRAWKYFPGQSEHTIEAVLWGSERDIRRSLSPLQLLKRVVRLRKLELNTFELDEDRVQRFLRHYRILRPKILRGYASSLFFMARYLERTGVRLPPPKAVVSAAETLWPEMRQTVEHVFSAPVFDSYGCREVSQIATECEAHDGLHLVVENQYVELLDGQILVTNLNNFAMPFLRYRIGDVATSILDESCRCGRSSPRLMGLRGRESEMIHLPNGKVVHGEYFTHLFYGLLDVSEFSVEYHPKQGEVVVLCSDLTPTRQALLRARIKEDFDFSNIAFAPTAAAAKSPQGKYRFVRVIQD